MSDFTNMTAAEYATWRDGKLAEVREALDNCRDDFDDRPWDRIPPAEYRRSVSITITFEV